MVRSFADYFLIIISIWLVILSFYLIKTIKSWKKLTGDAKSFDIEKILHNVITKQDLEERRISELLEEILKQKKWQVSNFQKYALIRFNPFEDTGGDQSFVIAILDGENNGVVISSMHTRVGTRVYAKEVVGAKPAAHQFSKEEGEAVEKATAQI